MARVMFDLDGVLRNWNGSWRRVFKTKHGYYPKVEPVWDGPWMALEKAGYKDPKKLLFEDWAYEITAGAAPYSQAKLVIYTLKEMKHSIIIITDQFSDAAKIGTLTWLANYRIIPDELYFTREKHTVKADYYIDDNDENLLKLVTYRPSSTVVRILRPWNEQTDYQGTSILTIKKLTQYVELINGKHTN